MIEIDNEIIARKRFVVDTDASSEDEESDNKDEKTLFESENDVEENFEDRFKIVTGDREVS